MFPTKEEGLLKKRNASFSSTNKYKVGLEYFTEPESKYMAFNDMGVGFHWKFRATWRVKKNNHSNGLMNKQESLSRDTPKGKMEEGRALLYRRILTN